MAEPISYEIREQAEELYIVDGRTFDDIAGITGVSVSQLKRWGAADAEKEVPSWTERRREYQQNQSTIRQNTVKLRAKLLKTALDSGDPQSVYAFAAIERIEASRKTASTTEKSAVPVMLPDKIRNIKSPADAVAALEEVIELKLNRLLSSPDVMKHADINDIEKSMKLISSMKQKYAPGTAAEQAETPDAARIKEIRDMIKL